MHKSIRVIIAIIGCILGYPIASLVISSPLIMSYLPTKNEIIIYVFCMLATAIILFFIYPFIIKLLRKITEYIETTLRDNTTFDILIQISGLIIGLILAALISSAFITFPVPGVQWILQITIYLVLGYLGWALAKSRSTEIKNIFIRLRKNKEISVPVRGRSLRRNNDQNAKLLDTSVIIDGRINDIFATNFIEGTLVIPTYVLNELQLISDSSDDLKRSKGRRGLDIVAQLQDQFGSSIRILEEDYHNIKEVDSKLIQTAKNKNWKIITNDYNLNKLASVQGIEILNINELANAVKMVLIPGEKIIVSLLKPGKESGQAIAYLEDGTMIVVEQGRDYIGETIEVIVTSVLQTSAGRMIFAKPNGE